MKTDEAFEILRRMQEPEAWEPQISEKAFDALEMAIDALALMRWIPVAERLPAKKEERYWICTDTGYQCQCRWTNNRFGIGVSEDWGWKIFDIPQYTKVVAWMPLPESYKEEKKK